MAKAQKAEEAAKKVVAAADAQDKDDVVDALGPIVQAGSILQHRREAVKGAQKMLKEKRADFHAAEIDLAGLILEAEHGMELFPETKAVKK